jgi:hypothetical protein
MQVHDALDSLSAQLQTQVELLQRLAALLPAPPCAAAGQGLCAGNVATHAPQELLAQVVEELQVGSAPAV